MGSGRCGASLGSQRCSFSTCRAYDAALGRRTVMCVAEVEGAVVPAAGRDRLDGKIRPLRELRGDQAAHEGGVDREFVGMHAVHRGRIIDGPVATRKGKKRAAGRIGPGPRSIFE